MHIHPIDAISVVHPDGERAVGLHDTQLTRVREAGRADRLAMSQGELAPERWFREDLTELGYDRTSLLHGESLAGQLRIIPTRNMVTRAQIRRRFDELAQTTRQHEDFGNEQLRDIREIAAAYLARHGASLHGRSRASLRIARQMIHTIDHGPSHFAGRAMRLHMRASQADRIAAALTYPAQARTIAAIRLAKAVQEPTLLTEIYRR